MPQYFPFFPIWGEGGVFIKLVEISSHFYILVILGFPLPSYSYPTSWKTIKFHSKVYHQFNPAMCSPLWLIVLVLLDDGQPSIATRWDTKEAQKNKVTLTVPGGGRSLHATQSHRGSTRFWAGGRSQEQGGCLGQDLHWCFFRKDKASRVNRTGQVSLNDFSGL